MPTTLQKLAFVSITLAMLAASSLVHGSAGLQERLEQLKPNTTEKLRDRFRRAGLAYPPNRAVIAVFKQERKLQLYAGYARGEPHLVHEYAVLGASGELGPKLREGDHQVPEGIYRISQLNPHSRYHLSLRLNYPNEFDRAMAAREARDQLGGDIYIHGDIESVGCVAIGDDAIEELFVLAADVGLEQLKVILSPMDLRSADPDPLDGARPSWTRRLYQDLRRALSELPSRRSPLL